MNRWYEKGLNLIANKGVDLDTDDIRLALVAAGYQANFVTDQYYSTPEAFEVAAGVALSGRSLSAGALLASPVTWPSVSGSPGSFAILFMHNGGASSTWPLLGYIDTAATLPVTPDGDDIVLTFAGGVVAYL